MAITVKAFLQDENGKNIEIRRFLVNNETDLSYMSLASKISNIFPALSSRLFCISWEDEENDKIRISSDEELALAIPKNDNWLFKVYVKCTDKKPSAPHAEKVNNAEKIHLNVICDGCDGKVYGARYKCLQCEDYDLCNDCHMKNIHPNHDMLKLTNPVMLQRWAFHGWKRVFEHIFGHNPYACSPNIPEFQRFRPNHFRCQKFEKSGEQSKPCSRNETKESEEKAKSTEFLTHIGEAVASFLDPLGIDVKIDLEHQDGERLPFSIIKKSCTKEEEENEKQKSSAATGIDNISKFINSKSSETTSEIPRSQSPSSASTSTGSDKEDTEQNSKSNTDLGAEGWTVVNESSEINESTEPQKNENSKETLPEQTETTTPKKPQETESNTLKKPEQIESTTPKKVSSADNTEQKLAPHIEVALDMMKSMGFNTPGNEMIRLLETYQGNISSVLDALFPGMTNQ